MKEYLNSDPLENAASEVEQVTAAHALLENAANFSIVMNLLGVDYKDVGVRIDEDTREIAVLARRETKLARRGFFWIFGVPDGALLNLASTRYEAGVLEIVIPKCG